MHEQRIPPSEQIRQQIDELLNNGIEAQDSPLSALLHLSAQLVVQEALERETTERLGRAWYQQRRWGEVLRGHRNGYEPGRLQAVLTRLSTRWYDIVKL